MSKQITITLSDSLVDDINEVLSHKRDGATFNSVVSDAVEQGVYQQLYHFKRNKVQWQKSKANKQLLNQLLSERSEMLINKKLILQDQLKKETDLQVRADLQQELLDIQEQLTK